MSERITITLEKSAARVLLDVLQPVRGSADIDELRNQLRLILEQPDPNDLGISVRDKIGIRDTLR